jgi:hypothetical protein
MSGGKGSSSNKSFSENISSSSNDSRQGSSSFVDPSQSPYLSYLRQQGQGLAGQQLAPGGQFQQGLGQQQQALGGFLGAPQQNPYLLGQIESGQNLINENLQQNILPGIGSNAQLAGQLGGGRQGVAEGIAMRDANRTGADFAQNLLGQDYQQQQARSLQALALAPSINQQGFSPLMNFGNLIGAPNNLQQAYGSSTGRSSGLARSTGKGGSDSKSLGF